MQTLVDMDEMRGRQPQVRSVRVRGALGAAVMRAAAQRIRGPGAQVYLKNPAPFHAQKEDTAAIARSLPLLYFLPVFKGCRNTPLRLSLPPAEDTTPPHPHRCTDMESHSSQEQSVPLM